MVIILLLALVTLPPAPTTYVTDPANVIVEGHEQALNERLAQYERESTNQLIVYVDRRLPEGTTLEELSTAAINTWGVGQKDKNNGVILFLFIEDRASRIEVGSGLETTLTDAHAKRILVSMRPALREGNYTRAVEDGVDAITRTIAGVRRAPLPNRAPVEVREPAESNWPLIYLAYLAGFILIVAVAWLILAIRDRQILPSAVSDSSGDQHWPRQRDSWDSSTSSSFSSGSSGSSSFSGGGGSGGGGGASDRW